MSIPTYGLISFTVRDANNNPLPGTRVKITDMLTGSPARLYSSAAPTSVVQGGGANGASGEVYADASGNVNVYAVQERPFAARAWAAGASTGAQPLFEIFNICAGQPIVQTTTVDNATPTPSTLTVSRNFLPSDTGSILVYSGSTGITLTLGQTLPTAFKCDVVQLGTGTITFASANGQTFVAVGSATHINVQYGKATVIQTGATTYQIGGNIA